MKGHRLWLALAGATGSLLAASVAAEVIVVKAEGGATGRYRAGQRLADNVVIRLGARESVTIVGKSGTRVFRGAGQFRPSDPVRAGTRGPPRAQTRIGGFNLSSIESGRATPSQWVVVRSTGPSARSWSPGQAVAANARVSLRAGDSLVLVGPAGTRNLRGPGSFSLNEPAALGAVGGGPGRVRAGARRDAGGAGTPPTIWHVDLRQSGTICFTGGGALMLWRPDATAAATLRIGRDGQILREIIWPAGAATIAWPTDLPFQSGAAYDLREGAAGVPVRVTLRALVGAPADPVGLASALLTQGCQAQAEALAEAMAATGGAPGPAIPMNVQEAVSFDPDRGGTICLPPGARIRLRRTDGGAGEYRLRSPTTRREALVLLENGVGDWPGSLLFGENEEIEISRAVSRAAPMRVRFRRIDAAVARGGDPVELAAALLERGCEAQLERMVAETRVD